MDHGYFRTNSMFRTFADTVMDLDPRDDLLFQGYWLESTDGFNYLEPEPSISSVQCDSPQYLPFKGSGHRSYSEETEKFPENPSLLYAETEDHVSETLSSSVQSDGSPLEDGQIVPEFCESWGCPTNEPEEEELLKVKTDWYNNGLDDMNNEQGLSEVEQLQHNPETKSSVESGGDACDRWSSLLDRTKTGKRKQTKTEKTISLQVLQKYFSGSLKDAAKTLGVCPTTLKRICRQYGINRWPSRKIKKVNHSLRKLQLLVDSVMGGQGLVEIDSFYTAFPELSSPNFSEHNPFSSFKITDYSKESNPEPESHLFSPKGIGSKSQCSSSCQDSGSNTSHPNETNGLRTGHGYVLEDPVEALKRSCSNAELYSLNQEEPASTQSHKALGACQHLDTLSLLPTGNGQNLQDGGVFRVKASFGYENVRFSLQPSWGFNDLQREIAKRFDIDDFSRIGLKYLDNDQESVLLTCDADLEECKDLLRFSQSRTIKISLYLASKPNLGSSFSDRNLFWRQGKI